VATFALGGLLWVPFIPVAYTMMQDEVDADEQQPMITLWNAILQGVAPLSLAASGALVAWFGATQTLWLSAETTLVLAAVAIVALVVAHVRAGRRARATDEAGAP
jgi:membrane protein YdbS with pleckstrin-like domain